MGVRTPAAVALLMGFLAQAGSAQVVFHPAPQPAPKPTPTAPRPAAAERRQGPVDLFRAGQGTYAPRFDGTHKPWRGPHPRWHHRGLYPPFGVVFVPTLPSWDRTAPSWAVETPAPAPPPALEPRVERRAPAAVEPEPRMAPIVIPPGHQRALYVIPRCYAGDTPPRQEHLPAGCDAAHARLVR